MYEDERVSTTFAMDFAIAEAFGENAVKDTYRRAMRGWKDNYKYLTELVIVLNHRIWIWSDEYRKTSNPQADRFVKTMNLSNQKEGKNE